MIQFTKYPREICLSGNPIVVELQADNAFTTRASAGATLLSIIYTNSQTIQDGGFFHLYFLGKTITITYKNSPDNSGNQIPIYAGQGNLYVDTVISYLEKNATIIRYFKLTNGGTNYIKFKARYTGSEYRLTSDYSYIIYPSEDYISSLVNNYARFGLLIEKGNDIIATIYEGPSNPTNSAVPTMGVYETDIADIISSVINRAFTFPETNTFYVLQNILEEFRLFGFIQSGLPSVDQNGIMGTKFKVLNGKVPDYIFGQYNDLGINWIDKLNQDNFFLTNIPEAKYTDIYAPEKLYYIFRAAGTYRVKVKLFFDDATDSTSTLATITVINAVELYELLCSYVKVKSGTKKIIKYDVWIANTSDLALSKVQTFIIDYRYQKWARYFIFKNEYGTYDTIRTSGEISRIIRIDLDVIDINLPGNHSQMDSGKLTTHVEEQVEFECNTGYFDKTQSEFYREFLKSPEIYWLYKNKAYPVNIEKGNYELQSDSKYLNSLKFKLVVGLKDIFDNTYTVPIPIDIGDFSIDFSTDFSIPIVPPSSEIVFETDFSRWDVPGIPYGFNIYNPYNLPLTTHFHIENNSNRLQIFVDRRHTLGITYNQNLIANQRYKLSFDLISTSSNQFMLFFRLQTSQSSGISTRLNLSIGRIEYEFISRGYNFNLYIDAPTSWGGLNPGNENAIIDNLKLEKIY